MRPRRAKQRLCRPLEQYKWLFRKLNSLWLKQIIIHKFLFRKEERPLVEILLFEMPSSFDFLLARAFPISTIP